VLADKEIIMAALNIKSMDFGANFVKVKILLFSYLQVIGGFLRIFSMYCIQQCFIGRPSDSTVSEDAGIEPRTVATSELAFRRSITIRITSAD
jgi:hypothetical protein